MYLFFQESITTSLLSSCKAETVSQTESPTLSQSSRTSPMRRTSTSPGLLVAEGGTSSLPDTPVADQGTTALEGSLGQKSPVDKLLKCIADGDMNMVSSNYCACQSHNIFVIFWKKLHIKTHFNLSKKFNIRASTFFRLKFDDGHRYLVTDINKYSTLKKLSRYFSQKSS